MLDADRALILAGAARRALPEHLLACRPRRACVSRSPASSASCVCRMIVFGFSSLPAPHAGQFTWQRPHSTQVNASSTHLAAEILDGLEPDLFLLEIEVRHVAELRRFQEHGDRRQHQMKVLRGRNQRQEREDHERVHPPVDPPAPAVLRPAGR